MEYIGFNGSQLQSYTYGFQGQERQAETGWSSFKWRNSIPELGRFFNIDPLAEEYSNWSTYAFSGNRVVDARELEGLEPVSTKREQDLPGNEMEFAEFIGEAINSVRAAFSNNVVRTINTVTNDAISNKYEVNSSGQLVLVTGVPKESFTEKVTNGSFDLATLALAAAGGPEGVLMAQGGKTPIIKGIEEVKATAKYSHLKDHKSVGLGKPFTPTQKKNILKENIKNNDGVIRSDLSGNILDMPTQAKKGVKANMNQAEIDHIKAKSKDGSNSHKNAQVLSKEENLKKRNK